MEAKYNSKTGKVIMNKFVLAISALFLLCTQLSHAADQKAKAQKSSPERNVAEFRPTTPTGGDTARVIPNISISTGSFWNSNPNLAVGDGVNSDRAAQCPQNQRMITGRCTCDGVLKEERHPDANTWYCVCDRPQPNGKPIAYVSCLSGADLR